MTYYENGGVAAAHLTWQLAGENPPAEDAIVVDDLDSGFVIGGPASRWHTRAEGYDGHLTWAWNKAWHLRYHWSGYNWARWYPDLAAGRYEAFVYIPERYTTSGQARYWVRHQDGFSLRIVDQSANGCRWVLTGSAATVRSGSRWPRPITRRIGRVCWPSTPLNGYPAELAR